MTCRRCSECRGEEHHWGEFVAFAEDFPEHPAAKLGYVCWYVCKHCDAVWRIDLEDDDVRERVDPEAETPPAGIVIPVGRWDVAFARAQALSSPRGSFARGRAIATYTIAKRAERSS